MRTRRHKLARGRLSPPPPWQACGSRERAVADTCAVQTRQVRPILCSWATHLLSGPVQQLLHRLTRYTHLIGDRGMARSVEPPVAKSGAGARRQVVHGGQRARASLSSRHDPFRRKVARQRGRILQRIMQDRATAGQSASAIDQHVARDSKQVSPMIRDRRRHPSRMDIQEYILHEVVDVVRRGSSGEIPTQRWPVKRHIRRQSFHIARRRTQSTFDHRCTPFDAWVVSGLTATCPSVFRNACEC